MEIKYPRNISGSIRGGRASSWKLFFFFVVLNLEKDFSGFVLRCSGLAGRRLFSWTRFLFMIGCRPAAPNSPGKLVYSFWSRDARKCFGLFHPPKKGIDPGNRKPVFHKPGFFIGCRPEADFPVSWNSGGSVFSADCPLMPMKERLFSTAWGEC